MSIILSAYMKNAFCEFLLPAVNNADTEIVLKKSVYGFREDLVLNLEIVDREWHIKDTDDYYVTMQQGDVKESLQNGDIRVIHEKYGNEITVIVRETECSFSVFTKYDLSNVQSISIGSETDNHIVYHNLSLVSRHHAILQRTQNGFSVCDKSSNGTFVNNKKVNGTQELCIGDCINIFGMKIVYLGNIIAVYAPEENPCRVVDALPEYTPVIAEKQQTESKKSSKTEKKFFHRAPRNYMKLETDAIEIEAPPAPKAVNKRPLWMMVGPSFTMVIPMLFGSILAIVNARSSGNNAGLYMYTGIITAAGSALIGAYWAITNIRYNNKEVKKGEEERFQAYGDYLVKRADYIREKYESSRNVLLTMYPAATVVAEYGTDSIALWNRNQKHEDFLCQRIGIGNLPFQMTINVPIEKFSLTYDKLAEKPRAIKEDYSILYDVPVNINLLEQKLIGVVGGNKKAGAFDIIRLMTAQIAANNCYTDVKMVFIYDVTKDEENWEYAKWFPHVWAEDKKTRYVASNKSQASDILYELTSVLRMRTEDEQQRKNHFPKPYYILVVSDMELLEDELITKYIYECNPCCGMTTLILSESREQLPNECEYFLEKNEEFCGIYDLGQDKKVPIKFDEISHEQLEKFSRRLSSIEVNEVEKGRDIPSSLSFFEMLQVQSLDELNVEERWRKNRTYENMRAMIGAKAGGVPCYLDVHEKYHGPHGLVAGTTGSGKSETLQTYMLSLAINYSPDDIGYFIIDYKGGGMAGLFDGLPHMIGSISNLSGNQVRRAMVSIKSENRRRQRIFSENNVNNINLYTRLYKNGEASIPVPHMFIIIDEFAELKKEEPEFMKELISVAQVGRSLGVHLILATQKPSGTVDENIWSNAKFRLCLRVQDKQDSNDMLHKPDAAYITQAGRSYLQVGNDEVYELFQSGYSGAIYDEESNNVKTEIASMVSLTGKAGLVGNSLKSKRQEMVKVRWVQQLLNVLKTAINMSNKEIAYFANDANRIPLFFDAAQNLDYPYTEYNGHRVDDLIQVYATAYDGIKGLSTEEEAREVIRLAEVMHKKLPEKKDKTQLDAVIEYLGQVAEREGYNHQMQLWLPLLPNVMYLDELQGYVTEAFNGEAWSKITGAWGLAVPVGLYDDPVNQAQMPLVIDFAQRGHLAICGSVISGKSCFLQTLLFALINKYQPDWLNIYAIDFSSRMLSCFEHAPHVGGVMYEDDSEKIDKFFHMMLSVLDERKKLFHGGNYSQYVQVNGVKVPAIVIGIDNFGAFREKTENKYDDKVLRLAKEGASYGIYLAVTALGFSTTEIFSRMSDNIKNVICLQMNDKFAYADALRNNHIEVLPENNVKGRGLAAVGERVLEFHTALAIEAEDDFKRIENIKCVCEKMKDIWEGKCAIQIPVIPEKPIWSEFETLTSVKEMQEGNRYLPIGYDMSSASVYGIDLSKTYSYLVSGKAKTGKTNLLKAIIRSASAKNGNLVVIEHGSADLKSTAMAVGAEYIDNQRAQADFFGKLVEPFGIRNKKKRVLLEEGKDDAEIYESMQKETPYFIVVADIVPFIQSIQKREEGITSIGAFVENVAEKGKLHNVFFFVGINPDTIGALYGNKICEGLIGYHTGVHLGGMVNNLRYFDFGNVSYTEQSKGQKIGIGMIPAGNEDDVSKIVIPLVRG